MTDYAEITPRMSIIKTTVHVDNNIIHYDET